MTRSQGADLSDFVNTDALAALPRHPGEPRTTPRFVEALVVAATMHAAQGRKGTKGPTGEEIAYASHLLGACSIALDYGATEDEAIAALLHDAIEDVKPAEASRVVVARFGDRVARIVDGCTKSEPEEGGSTASKREYVKHIRETPDASILLVSAADKLHNARSIVRDLRAEGPRMLGRFNSDPAETLAYYRGLANAFRDNPAANHALSDELGRVVTEMESLARV
jgi:(p)ppGpp synthase/HD superfamily hydrolase